MDVCACSIRRVGDQITYGHQSRFLVDAIPLSDLSNIIVETNQTAKTTLSCQSLQHTWCYYFAKAELARQKGDWDQVIDLIDEARSLGYKPEDPFEWLTYIEAQALTGNIEGAKKTSEDAFKQENEFVEVYASFGNVFKRRASRHRQRKQIRCQIEYYPSIKCSIVICL